MIAREAQRDLAIGEAALVERVGAPATSSRRCRALDLWLGSPVLLSPFTGDGSLQFRGCDACAGERPRSANPLMQQWTLRRTSSCALS